MKDIDPKRRYRKVSVLMIHWEKEGTDSFDAQKEVCLHLEIWVSFLLLKSHRWIVSATYSTEDTTSVSLKGSSTLGKRHSYRLISIFPVSFATKMMNTLCSSSITLVMALQTKAQVACCWASKPLFFSRRDRLVKMLMTLCSGNQSASDEVSDYLTHIVWQEAENLIHTASRPDIFLIFDCCHAGRLLNMRHKPAWGERIFEFLGATGPNGTTPLPGKESFTSALIWALEELANEGACFMSSELLEKILKAPDFHRDGQVPCMNERGPHCVRKLILEPMASGTEKPRSNSEGRRDEASELFKYCLNLQFLLPDAPDNKEIKRMCDSLRELIVFHRFYARQILWQGLYPKEDARSEFPRLVREFAARWQNQTLKKKIRSLSYGGSLGEEKNGINLADSGESLLSGNESPDTVTGHSKRGSEELNAADLGTAVDSFSDPKRPRMK